MAAKRPKIRRATVSIVATLNYYKDDRWYVGELRDFPGVISQGRTLASLRNNIRDAFRLMLGEAPRRQDRRPSRTSTIHMDV